MIVLLNKSGQLGNQLLALGWAYSLTLQHHESLFCPVVDTVVLNSLVLRAEDEVKVNFSSSKKWGAWVFFVDCLYTLTQRLRLPWKEKYNADKRRNVFYTWGEWNDLAVFVKYQPEIRAFFAFQEHLSRQVDANIQALRVEKLPVIAVHMRRGDYREWSGGRYYYSDEEYACWMKQLQAQHDAVFVLFSNEKIDVAFFVEQGLRAVAMNGTAIEDLCCMSKCDYIIGPPSSYSIWAAIVGNKKYIKLDAKDDVCAYENFAFFEERWRMKNQNN